MRGSSKVCWRMSTISERATASGKTSATWCATGSAVRSPARCLVRRRGSAPTATPSLAGRAARERNLQHLTNNTRFLIPRWVRVPHLASHVLGLIARRIRSDWQEKYGHPVHALETFVERSRFRGTCYRAANWQRLGETRGRTRNDRNNTIRVEIKDVYLHPLTPRFREELCSA